MFQRLEFIGAGRDGGRRHGQLHNPTSWTHSLQQCQYMTNNFFSFSTHYSTVCIGGAEENTAWETPSVGYTTSRDANPWGDSRGMRLLQGQGGAGHRHS